MATQNATATQSARDLGPALTRDQAHQLVEAIYSDETREMVRMALEHLTLPREELDAIGGNRANTEWALADLSKAVEPIATLLETVASRIRETQARARAVLAPSQRCAGSPQRSSIATDAERLSRASERYGFPIGAPEYRELPADRLFGRLIQARAQLEMTYGVNGEAFRAQGDELQDAYMWGLSELVSAALGDVMLMVTKSPGETAGDRE